MKRILSTLICTMLLTTSVLVAQQDAMFTKYLFNSLSFNPAYAGSHDYLSAALIHRTQWWGIQGAPTTQSLTVHSPIRMKNVGIGGTLIHDEIGPTRTITAQGAYAYHVPLGGGKLSIGLQGGITNWRANFNGVERIDPADEAFMGEDPNLFLPNFGAGLYYYQKYWYLGFASPNLIEHDLRDQNVQADMNAQQYRHYFATAGAAIPLDGAENFVFRPTALVKNVGLFGAFADADELDVRAPTEIDIDMSVMFYKTLWVGVAFRSAFDLENSSIDSGDIWAAWYLDNGLRIGAAFDYTLSELNQVAGGSFEVMLGYDMNYDVKSVVTPRYF